MQLRIIVAKCAPYVNGDCTVLQVQQSNGNVILPINLDFRLKAGFHYLVIVNQEKMVWEWSCGDCAWESCLYKSCPLLFVKAVRLGSLSVKIGPLLVCMLHACCMRCIVCCNLASCIRHVFSRWPLNVWSFFQWDFSLYKGCALEAWYLAHALYITILVCHF